MRVLKILGIVCAGLIILIIVSVLTGTYLLKKDQPQMFTEPVLEQVPVPVDLGERPLVIVYSKTNGYRHREAIAGGIELFERLAKDNGWHVVVTENSGIFTDSNLAHTAAVILNNTTGPFANHTQQKALRTYLMAGGGVLAIHAAGDGSHSSWPWYQDEVIRARFTSAARFPPLQQATIVVDQPNEPTVSHLPGRWSLTDEWYSFDRAPKEVDVLGSLDETSYNVFPFGMGGDHPIMWRHENLGGRVAYIGHGHKPETFHNEEYRDLLHKVLLWICRKSETDTGYVRNL